TRNVFTFLICIGTSIPNAIFGFCILVIIGERLSRLFSKRVINSKKTNIFRIITMLGYVIIAISTGFLLNLTYYLIDFFLNSFVNLQDLTNVNLILSLIPFPFAPAYLISIISLQSQVQIELLLTSLIGFSLFLIIIWRLFRIAFRSLHLVTTTESEGSKAEEASKKVIESLEDIQIEVKTPIKSYLKKDLVSLTRDYQSFMFFIMPIIWPALMLIIMSYPIAQEVSSTFSIMILWGIILSLCIFIPMILIIGLINLEESGESALASLPTVPRKQAKAKLILISLIQTVSFILISIIVTIQIKSLLFMIIYFATLPISWIFLLSMLKVRKWILIFAIEVVLYFIIQVVGYLLFGILGIISTALALFIIGFGGLGIVIFIFNRMFPKVEKMSSYYTGGILRENPLLGILVLLVLYFSFNFLPGVIEIVFILPFIQYFSYISLRFIEFGLTFCFSATLWYLIVPKGLKLPIVTKSLKEYAKAIHLTTYKPIARNLFLALTISAIYFFSFFLGGNLLGTYIFDLNILFGNPNPYVSGFFGLGWFLFIFMLIPGIWEETSFRGVMIPLLQNKYQKSTSILLSGTIFGLFHATNLISVFLNNTNPFGVYFQMVYASFIGITLAYTYVKTQSLLPVIIIHYLIDTVGQLFLYTIIYDYIQAAIYLIFFIGVIPSILSILLVKITTGWKSKSINEKILN
ncbi:MAG: CPBP family glutamic-type intramembrane protease, partial [Candidatus Lokiarchaeota archaeon]